MHVANFCLGMLGDNASSAVGSGSPRCRGSDQADLATSVLYYVVFLLLAALLVKFLHQCDQQH